MFDGVVKCYDFMNQIMMFGVIDIWCDFVVVVVELEFGQIIFDLVVGIGIFLVMFVVCGVQVYFIDIFIGMLVVGKQCQFYLYFVVGDVICLFYVDNFFDVVMIFYGLCNVEDL